MDIPGVSTDETIYDRDETETYQRRNTNFGGTSNIQDEFRDPLEGQYSRNNTEFGVPGVNTETVWKASEQGQVQNATQAFNSLLRNSPNPEYDKQKLEVVQDYAEITGMDVQYVWNNLDNLAKHTYQDEPGEFEIVNRWKDARTNSKLQMEISDLSNEFRFADEERREEIDYRLGEIRNEFVQVADVEGNFFKRNFFEGIEGAVSQFPMWTRSFLEGVPQGLASATALAGIVAIAGQAGPQIALPEEIVTIPGALAKGYLMGQATGSAQAMRSIQRGNQFNEFRGLGMDEDLAWTFADIIGASEGFLEIAQAGSAAKFLTGAGGTAFVKVYEKAMGKAFKDQAFNRIIKTVAAAGQNITEEATEEAVQQLSTVLATHLAFEIQNQRIRAEKASSVLNPRAFEPLDPRGTRELIPQPTVAEDINEVISAFRDSLNMLAVVGLPKLAIRLPTALTQDITDTQRNIAEARLRRQKQEITKSGEEQSDAVFNRTETSQTISVENIESREDLTADRAAAGAESFEAAQAGQKMEPIKVVETSPGTFRVASGNANFVSAIQGGLTSVEVEIVDSRAQAVTPEQSREQAAEARPQYENIVNTIAQETEGSIKIAQGDQLTGIRAEVDPGIATNLSSQMIFETQDQADIAIERIREETTSFEVSRTPQGTNIRFALDNGYIAEVNVTTQGQFTADTRISPLLDTLNTAMGGTISETIEGFKTSQDVAQIEQTALDIKNNPVLSPEVREAAQAVYDEVRKSQQKVFDSLQPRVEQQIAPVQAKQPYEMTPDEFAAGIQAPVREARIEQRRELDEQVLRELFKEEFPEWVQDETDAAIAVAEKIAKYKGQDVDTWLRENLRAEVFTRTSETARDLRQDRRKAAVSFADDARALIHLSDNSDFTSWVHEIGHVLRRNLNEVDRKLVEAELGIEDGIWTTEHEEQFVRMLEDHLKNNTKQGTIFDKIAQWFKEVYFEMRKNLTVPENVAKLFNEIFGEAEAALFQTEDDSQVFRDEPLLVTQHNLSRENLAHAQKIGGLAAPSLAITTPDTATDAFGEISLLAGPELIDPKARRVDVFAEDVYSPRYPSISYDIDTRTLYDRLEESQDIFPSHIDIEDNGLEGLYRSNAVKFKYFREQGKLKTLPKTEKKYPNKVYKSRPSTYDQKGFNQILDLYIDQQKKSIKKFEEKNVNGILDFRIDAMKDDLRKSEDIRAIPDFNEQKQVATDELIFNSLTSIEYEIRNHKDIDSHEIRAKMDKGLRTPKARQDFRQWVDETFIDVIRSERLFDGFTPAGKRKYRAHTLENVTQTLSKDIRGGESFSYGVNSIKAELIRKFRSIAEIKGSRGDLVGKDAYEKSQEKLSDMYNNVSEMLGDNPHVDSHLVEAVKYGMRTLDKYYDTYDEQLIQSFFDELRIAPAKYFEAVIKRPVDISEFKSALVPTGVAYNESVEFLKSKGVAVKRYKDQDQRKELLSKQKDVLFQDEAEDQVSDHESIVKDAVEKGLPVPDEILNIYADRQWAIDELASRDLQSSFNDLLEDARETDSPEELRAQVEAFGEVPEDMTEKELDDFYTRVWNRANLLNPEEAQKRWEETIKSDESVQSIIQTFVNNRDELVGAGISSVKIWSAINQLAAGTKQSPKQLAVIRSTLRNAGLKYREILARIEGDKTAIDQIEHEKTLGLLRPDTVDEELAKLTVHSRIKLARTTDDVDLRDKILKGNVSSKGLFSLDKQYREEIKTLEGKIEDLDEDIDTRIAASVRKTEKVKTLEKKVFSLEKDVTKLDKEIEAVKEKKKEQLSKLRNEKNQKIADLNSEMSDIVKSARSEARLGADVVRKELKEAFKKKDALRKVRVYKQQLAKRILKEPSKNTAFEYKRQIRELQEALDGAFRRLDSDLAVKTAKEIKEIDLAFFKDMSVIPDLPVEARELVDSILDKLQKKPLNLWTLSELEKLDTQVRELRQRGRDLYRLREERRKGVLNNRAVDMNEEVLEGETVPEHTDLTSKETRKLTESNRWWKLASYTFVPNVYVRNTAGLQEGEFYRFWVDDVNKAQDNESREVNRRRKSFKGMLETLKYKQEALGKRRTLSGVKDTHTVSEIIGMYAASQNIQSHAAVFHGNKIQQMDRWIATLTNDEKTIGDWILDDFSGDNYNRLRDAHIRNTNDDLGKVDRYFPMLREGDLHNSTKEELAAQLLSRANATKVFPDRKFTKERIENIPPEFQEPIRLDIVSLWSEQIQKQEHYISHYQWTKDANYMMSQTGMRASITAKHGRQVAEWYKNHINVIANPNIYKAYGMADKIVKQLRTNLAIAALGFNMSTVLKQIPSLMLYMSRAGGFTTGSLNLMKSSFQFNTGLFNGNAAKMYETIRQKDPQWDDRVMSRYMEDLKSIEASNIFTKAQKKLATASMFLIAEVDKAVTATGWNAVYNHNLQFGEAEAVRMAQQATLETQPSGRAKDIPVMLQDGGALSLFTLFSNQTNKIYNMIAGDILPSIGRIASRKTPNAIKKQLIQRTIANLVATSMSGVAMMVISGWVAPDDDDEFAFEALMGFLKQQSGLLPIIGGGLQSGLSGYESGVDPFPVVNDMAKILKRMSEGKELSQKQVERTLVSAGTVLGVPGTIAANRVKNAVEVTLDDNFAEGILEIFGPAFRKGSIARELPSIIEELIE